MTENRERGSEAIERVPAAATGHGALSGRRAARRPRPPLRPDRARGRPARQARAQRPDRHTAPGQARDGPDGARRHPGPRGAAARGPPVPGLGPSRRAHHRRLHGPGRRPLRPQRHTAHPLRRGHRRQRGDLRGPGRQDPAHRPRAPRGAPERRVAGGDEPGGRDPPRLARHGRPDAPARRLRRALRRPRRDPSARDPLPAAAGLGQRDDRGRRRAGRPRPALQ